MKAAQITQYGGPEVFVIQEVGTPKPAPDQVLVQVKAAGVNPFDIKVRDGEVRQMAELTFPATLGGDLAGVVSKLGSDVKDFKIGDEVYGQAGALSGKGSFAEYALSKAGSLAIKPSNIDFLTAAAAPLVTVSAYMALIEHINLQPNQKILIHGGSGGIGSQAIQLAKHIGAYVATTAANGQKDYVKQLGADEFIDYNSQDFSEIIKNYDAVYDTVGDDIYKKSYKVLKAGGKIVSMTAEPDEELSKQYNVTAIYQFTQVTTERLNKVRELIESGVLTTNIYMMFPLDQTGNALEYLKTSHVRGKVVIQI